MVIVENVLKLCQIFYGCQGGSSLFFLVDCALFMAVVARLGCRDWMPTLSTTHRTQARRWRGSVELRGTQRIKSSTQNSKRVNVAGTHTGKTSKHDAPQKCTSQTQNDGMRNKPPSSSLGAVATCAAKEMSVAEMPEPHVAASGDVRSTPAAENMA